MLAMHQMPSATAMKREFGQRLRVTREARGFSTLREFAAAIDVDERTAGGWERGARYPPPVYLLKIKNLTGVTADYLLFGDSSGMPVDLHLEIKRLQSRSVDRSGR